MSAVAVVEPTLISMNDAAKMLGVPYYEIYNLSSSGRIGRVKKGTRVFVPQDDVRALMATRQEIASPIAWHPIAEMPEDRKNGRNMLLWFSAGYPAICNWDGAWCDSVGFVLNGATMWADVEGPVQ
ncbi:hypothetical protein LH128_00195 [Sphingomonas sp. LH128]|uniref:helix-turn-helix domain-containing protein n=1 Tax=Sphingomonas sp. LH128 TaxID=473781 RepID=UPI00027CB152|nr:helix-turn-helix domain-containing protein [Sphingomonas sp. LH128]EJU15156.1 hypothetical protein LH128_00195 [Sphingomonas sp. LH128]